MNQPEVVSKGLPEPRMPFQPLSKFRVGPVANMAVLAGLASALVFLFLLDPWQDPPAEAGPGLQGSVPGPPFEPEDDTKPPQKYPNLDSSLNRRVTEAEDRDVSGSDDHSSGTHSELITIHTRQPNSSIIEYLQRHNVSVRNQGADYIEAHVPLRLVAAVSQLDAVLKVYPIHPPHADQVNDGSSVHVIAPWQTEGYNGSDIRVGILDQGYNKFEDLIGTQLITPSGVLCFDPDVPGTSDHLSDCKDDGHHGTAVAEAILDIAPNVTLYLANPQTKGDVHVAVDWMIANNVDVINYSTSWSWDGPGDGTSHPSSSPLKAVDTAVNAGILWVNSAGNSGGRAWMGAFKDDNDNKIHEFGIDTEENGITTKRGDFYAQLRWDDHWPGATPGSFSFQGLAKPRMAKAWPGVQPMRRIAAAMLVSPPLRSSPKTTLRNAAIT